MWQPGKNQEYCREELNTINTSLVEWANDFAATTAAPWQSLPENKRWQFVNNVLSTVTKMNDGMPPTSLMNDEGTILLLDALVAHHLYKTYLLDRSSALLIIEFPRLGARSLGCDKVAAHKWRYETLRCLSPLDDQKLHTQTRTLLNQAAKDEVDLFLGSTISCLLNTNRKNEYHRRLVEIFETASWRAYDIWCERAYIRCTLLKEFSEMIFGDDDKRWPADYLEKLKQMLDVVKGDGELLCTRPWVELVDTVVEENAEGVKQEHEDCIHLSAPFYVEL